MADVVDLEAITIVPSPHVELAKRRPVVRPERLVEEEMAITLIRGDDASATLEQLKCYRLQQQTLPVERLLLGRGRLSGLRL